MKSIDAPPIVLSLGSSHTTFPRSLIPLRVAEAQLKEKRIANSRVAKFDLEDAREGNQPSLSSQIYRHRNLNSPAKVSRLPCISNDDFWGEQHAHTTSARSTPPPSFFFLFFFSFLFLLGSRRRDSLPAAGPSESAYLDHSYKPNLSVVVHLVAGFIARLWLA